MQVACDPPICEGGGGGGANQGVCKRAAVRGPFVGYLEDPLLQTRTHTGSNRWNRFDQAIDSPKRASAPHPSCPPPWPRSISILAWIDVMGWRVDQLMSEWNSSTDTPRRLSFVSLLQRPFF